MPEGDTVHRSASRLHAALAGTPLSRVELRWGELDGGGLIGATTLEVVSRGKHLLHRVEGGWTIHSHLRMEGQWRVERVAGPEERRYLASRQTRAALAAGAWAAFGLRLGMLDLVRTSDEGALTGHLGPDILDEALDVESVVQALRASGRPVAESLLDQRLVAGIGTFWASEALFVERVHPWARTDELGPQVLARLVRRCHLLMRRATGHAVQSSTGVYRHGETAYVHARSGRPCRRCGETVRVAMAGPAGQERTIFSCPTCQGGLAPTDDGRPQAPLGARRPARGRGSSRSR
ncbi:Fpg/Nei family DNA glycosylase [Janibacter sp. YIM B02568]|uniref:DNA-formamidopyrimidine glycosylase family protein n=1 Tax=Janibacter endophyticus TaxID=2806261 RepID=UPI00194E70EA|nr:DNA-formamidopyrimidine glycosylase family protein [Janibacter endophyticus]MBM6546729.1 Fpg/Nei family DNA glycosylase [Janibacter endophyticus]